jgi:hypothetical protein
MTRYLLPVFITATLVAIRANPIALSTIALSELYFDEHNQWTLELAFDTPGWPLDVDSVALGSTQQQSMLPASMIPGVPGIIVVRASDFTPPMIIRREGDVLDLSWRSQGRSVSTVLVFGDKNDASVTKLLPGHSIALVGLDQYARDCSPSIGLPNDTAGTHAFLRGVVYDASSKPVSSMTFRFDLPYNTAEAPFTTSETGAYSAPVFARSRSCASIYYQRQGYWRSCAMRSLQYDLQPDSVRLADIFLQGSLSPVEASMPAFPDALLALYPDPAKAGASVRYQTTLPVVALRAEMSMFDMQGRVVMRRDLSGSDGAVTLPAALVPGAYLVVIHSDGKVLGRARITILR